ncbi:c-type cytochrome biogenesis protein CcmI [Gammaproteobacteria bacterium 42_54_T18]|nr:c-type cytochrome biogenesis protein CcmI [Gammaproteobacteria bacterium 42_54_T18]
MGILVGILFLMALAATAMIVGPLMAKQQVVSAQQDVSRDAVNSVVFSDRLTELQLDVATNTISQKEFEKLKIELEIGLLSDVPDEPKGAILKEKGDNKGVVPGMLAAVAVLTLVPILSLGLYYQGGYSPEIEKWLQLRKDMDPVFTALMAGDKPEASGADRTVMEFVTALQRKAQEYPDDANMWHMLGMGYQQMQAAEQAEQALRRAYRIEPDNSRYRLALAQLLVGIGQGKITQESESLLLAVLKSDPVNMQALAMLGMGEFFAERFQQSLMYWERLLVVSRKFNAPQEKIDILKRSIAAAKKRLNIKGDQKIADADTGSGLQLQVTVSIDSALQKTLNPTDTLFIYAQKAQGPKMPLAVVKKQVGEFPITVTLSDKQAMTPQFRLSNAETVVVKARVSATHNAIPASGDLLGKSNVIELAAIINQPKKISVVIDATVP